MLKHSLRYSEAVSIKSYLTDSSIELYRALLYSHSGCVKEECSRLLVAVFSWVTGMLVISFYPASLLAVAICKTGSFSYQMAFFKKQSSYELIQLPIAAVIQVHQIDSIWLDKAIDYLSRSSAS